jgi:hypothetical protein
MAIKKRNGDAAVLITRSPSGHKTFNYQSTVKKWTDEDWVLIDESPKGFSLELTFRYKRYILRPTAMALKVGLGQRYPTAPHPSQFLSQEEAEKATEGGYFWVDETEPPYEKMGVK